MRQHKRARDAADAPTPTTDRKPRQAVIPRRIADKGITHSKVGTPDHIEDKEALTEQIILSVQNNRAAYHLHISPTLCSTERTVNHGW